MKKVSPYGLTLRYENIRTSNQGRKDIYILLPYKEFLQCLLRELRELTKIISSLRDCIACDERKPIDSDK